MILEPISVSGNFKQLCRNVLITPKIFEIAERDVAVGYKRMVMHPLFIFWSKHLGWFFFLFLCVPSFGVYVFKFNFISVNYTNKANLSKNFIKYNT